MLVALLADLAALPDVKVCTTWDARLGEFPLHNGVADGSPLNIECAVIRADRDEADTFRRLTAECDATYVIAPELDDLLTQRVQMTLDAGGRSLNASPEAIAACSDKWETFQRLSHAGIATVPTARFDSGLPLLFDFPLVMKPRFGAGSQDTFLVRNRDDFETAAARFSGDRPTTEAILQPYIAGRALSVAAIFRTDGTLRVWPVAEQQMSEDGRFSYLGGQVGGIFDFGFSILDLMSRVSDIAPGLRGYIGCDVILPTETNAAPLIVDINPRLTTSYLGYRALSRVNLAGRLLWPDDLWPSLDWHGGRVEFGADGAATRFPAGRG
jgi:predicted ATP-grasp superfamily ATP-dependent carboligase